MIKAVTNVNQDRVVTMQSAGRLPIGFAGYNHISGEF
jgi:hypothetical protein